MKNKFTGFLLTTLVAFVVVGCANNNSSIYSEVKSASDEINKRCPMAIDEHTRLDNTKAKDNPVELVYNYTIVSAQKKEIEGQLADIKQSVKEQTQKNIDNTTDLKLYADNHIPLRYSYSDKNGVFLFDFTIIPNKPTKK
jgi:hypothetical protein